MIIKQEPPAKHNHKADESTPDSRTYSISGGANSPLPNAAILGPKERPPPALPPKQSKTNAVVPKANAVAPKVKSSHEDSSKTKVDVSKRKSLTNASGDAGTVTLREKKPVVNGSAKGRPKSWPAPPTN